MKQYTVTMQITYTVEANNREEARKQAVLQLQRKLAFAILHITNLQEGGESI